MNSKYVYYPFIGQHYEDSSFNIALINSCIYKRLEIPLLSDVNKNKKEYIKKLNLKNGNNIKQLFQRGGIITVNHVLLDIIHSFLMIKDENNTYVLINSFMGPTILSKISREKIEKVFNIVDGYYFED